MPIKPNAAALDAERKTAYSEAQQRYNYWLSVIAEKIRQSREARVTIDAIKKP